MSNYKKILNNNNAIELDGKVILRFDPRYKDYLEWKAENPDLEKKLDYILSNYSSLQKRITENMRKKFSEATNKEKFALHLYDIFNKLEGVTTYD